MAKNALHSLFGGKQAALRAESIRQYLADQDLHVADEQIKEIMLLAKGKSALSGNIGGQNRDQVVLTPEWFLDALRPYCYDQTFYLDPATEPSNPAKAFYHFDEEANGLERDWGPDGPWGEGYYFWCNPPFGKLSAWMRKAHLEFTAGAQGWMLAPTRGHRVWFAGYSKDAVKVHLRPFPFQGQTSCFPAPLCLLCYGAPAPGSILDNKGREMIVSVER